ncbi:uncharacterized protein EI90DRAFT_3032086 [Cantharellus anzutake]|uniref:uncharacterized protein n=1 Tax=Cantharellus anzutake TaxID=1750568 RepID=UPI001906DB72|nr:uncharacterized protein EI90DRAFT_3032086 [Cantharellus anzutake]KAF8342084.1 hypothetical protein EI90DRAFT_3032086 [Cantharellus anzutake]
MSCSTVLVHRLQVWLVGSGLNIDGGGCSLAVFASGPTHHARHPQASVTRLSELPCVLPA